MLEWGTVQQQN